MPKEFLKWHEVKEKIESDHPCPLFQEREIWWCSLGANIGFEEDGKHDRFERPVLVIRKFNSQLLWAVPLSTKIKEGIYYQTFELHSEQRSALLSQARTVSAKRLLRRIGKIQEDQFDQVVCSLVALYNRTDPLRGPRVPSGNL